LVNYNVTLLHCSPEKFMPMPGLSALDAGMSCAPQQSVDLPASAVLAPAVALPNLVQLLLREALTMKMSAAMLNRLWDRPGIEPFSVACVEVLRSQLGVEQLSDLCALDTLQFRTLSDLTPDEQISLEELCQWLKRELSMSSVKIPLVALAQQPSKATRNSEDAHKLVMHAQKPVMSFGSGETLWPEHQSKHLAGECQPCAYYFKPDSCKWGAKCDFCHLCPDGEIKTRKKEKLRALREQAVREKNAKQTPKVVSLSLSSALQY
jgi:hypothetical protein